MAKFNCEKCGYIWSAAVSNRRPSKTGNGCAACKGVVITATNCLAATHPHLIPLWHKSNGKTPYEVKSGSSNQAEWSCSACAHVYRMPLQVRTGKSLDYLCPGCSGMHATPWNCLAALHPDLAGEWHEGNEKSAFDYRPGSGHRAKWCCSDCGHLWRSRILSRTALGRGCPACSGLERGRYGLAQIGADRLLSLNAQEREEAMKRWSLLTIYGREHVLVALVREGGIQDGRLPVGELRQYLDGEDSSLIAHLLEEAPYLRRPSVNRSDRVFILARDGQCCQLCGREEGLTIDHFWAWTWGGLHDRSNYWTLCSTCNQGKSAKPPSEALLERWMSLYGVLPPEVPEPLRALASTSVAAGQAIAAYEERKALYATAVGP